MNINLCIKYISIYILYIYFTTEEKFIFEISTFVVDATVAHIPRQRTLGFQQEKKKKREKHNQGPKARVRLETGLKIVFLHKARRDRHYRGRKYEDVGTNERAAHAWASDREGENRNKYETVRMKGVFREKEIYKWEKVVFGYLYTVISVKFLS